MENFIFQDSIKIEKKYKNGKCKFIETLYTYKIKGKSKIYKFNAGYSASWLKNDDLFWEIKYDNYGTALYYRAMTLDGNLSKELTTTKIDTKSDDIRKALGSSKYLIFETYEKQYEVSKDNQPCLVWEGAKSRGKKIGVWKKYNCCGEIVKTKNY
ncbi:hypothetical protein ACSIGC_17585 [Tenacibaculum sp. ZS6-P6]|uniref:hypothetical protein n=1 Tax=Tenacibaculum sp. ZS6-P6 TaxID=3447503 RepID=UPI003F98A75E